MYNHEIEYQQSFNCKDPVTGDNSTNLIPFAKLWKLGERTLMPALQNVALAKIDAIEHCASDDGLVQFSKFAYLDDEQTMLKAYLSSKLHSNGTQLFSRRISSICRSRWAVISLRS